MDEYQWTQQQAEEIGARITSARNSLDMTMEALSAKVGKTKAAVGHWENGVRTIKLDDLARLSVVLNVSLDWLVFGKESGAWPFGLVDQDEYMALEREERGAAQKALGDAIKDIKARTGKRHAA